MSERHETLDGRDAVLRTELTSAIKIRNATATDLKQVEAKVERGLKILAQAESEVEALQASHDSFKERCTADYSLTVLAAIENGTDLDPISMGRDNDTFDIQPLNDARLRLDACRAASRKLNDDHDKAKSDHKRAIASAETLVDAIVTLQIERQAKECIQLHHDAWLALDSLKAACILAEGRQPGSTKSIQDSTLKGITRYPVAVAECGYLLPEPDYDEYLAKKAQTFTPRWLDFATRLTNDATATINPESKS